MSSFISVVLELLLQKDTAASDRITEFVTQLSMVSSNADVYRVLTQMKVKIIVSTSLSLRFINISEQGFLNQKLFNLDFRSFSRLDI